TCCAAGGSTVRGLAYGGFLAGGSQFETGGGNLVEGCYLGTDPTGKSALGNRTGVDVRSGSNGNTVGGTTPAARNLLSGNTPEDGVYMQGVASNVVLGNYIGTDVTGTLALGNGERGVQTDNGATSNVVGGTAAGARNVIAANLSDGVHVGDSSLLGTTGNSVIGNFIGVDVTGTVALANASHGIQLGPVANTMIGG